MDRREFIKSALGAVAANALSLPALGMGLTETVDYVIGIDTGAHDDKTIAAYTSFLVPKEYLCVIEWKNISATQLGLDRHQNG